MKKTIIFLFAFILGQINAQTGAFRLQGNSINIGFNNHYRFMTFGTGNNGSINGPFAIEHDGGGLNFWKPWPSSNNGNYNFYISDIWKTCVNMKNDDVYSTNYLMTNNFQVRGYGQAHGWWVWSDTSLKRNITNLNVGLAKILELNPVSYYYKENNLVTGSACDSNIIKKTTMEVSNARVNPIDNSPSALRFGFRAQDLETIFPNLVSNAAAQKSVNYIELIPVLVNAIKEQEAKIQQLTQEIQNWKGRSIDTTNQNASRLFQNNPNPFNGITTISYFIDENSAVNNAVIEVRNIMGNLQNTITLGDRSGMGQVDFDGSNLTTGYYIYTLRINNSIKDSKMFLKE